MISREWNVAGEVEHLAVAQQDRINLPASVHQTLKLTTVLASHPVISLFCAHQLTSHLIAGIIHHVITQIVSESCWSEL